jgi:hypothetical protein
MEEEVGARIGALVNEPFELSRLDTRWLALGAEVVAFAAQTEAEWRRSTPSTVLEWLV